MVAGIQVRQEFIKDEILNGIQAFNKCSSFQRVGEKVRALSGSTSLIKHEVPIQVIEDVTVHMDHSQMHQVSNCFFERHILSRE